MDEEEINEENSTVTEEILIDENFINSTEIEILELKKEKLQVEIHNLKSDLNHKAHSDRWQKYDVWVKLAGSIISATIIAITVFFAMNRNIENKEREVRLQEIKNEETLSEIEQKIRLNETQKNQILADKAELDLELIAKKRDSLSKINYDFKKNIESQTVKLNQLEVSKINLTKVNKNLSQELNNLNDELDFRETAYYLDIYKNNIQNQSARQYIVEKYQNNNQRLIDSIEQWISSRKISTKLGGLYAKYGVNKNENIRESINQSLFELFDFVKKSDTYSKNRLEVYWSIIQDSLLYNKQTALPIVEYGIEILDTAEFANDENYFALTQYLMYTDFRGFVNLRQQNPRLYFQLLQDGKYSLEMDYYNSRFTLAKYSPELSILMFLKLIEISACKMNRYETYDIFYPVEDFTANIQTFLQQAQDEFEFFIETNNWTDFPQTIEKIEDSEKKKSLCVFTQSLIAKYSNEFNVYFSENKNDLKNYTTEKLIEIANSLYVE